MAQGNRGAAASNNSGEDSSEEEDPCVSIDDHRFCWKQDPITGIHFPQVPDTTHLNLAVHQTMEGQSLGLLHTSNLFSPHHIIDFFDKRDAHDYIFVNAYPLFAYRPADLIFYNTHLPYTNAAYTTSGSNRQSNDRLRVNFVGNLNKHLGVGSFLDYVYARGEYIGTATKPLTWSSYLYYDSEQYKATLSYNLSKLANQENGGILNRGYVLTPDDYDDSFTQGYTMPVKLEDTWNDMNGYNVHFTHSYDLGMWDEYTNPNDTTELLEQFTSVASIFHSFDYEHYDHKFITDSLGDNGRRERPRNPFFPGIPNYNLRNTLDSTEYTSLSTYLGFRINEGFSRWSQFGLAAFVGFQHQRYTMMQDTLDLNYIQRVHASNSLFIGGQISRQLSDHFTFDATARFGLSGDKSKDIDITGHLQTIIPAGRKDSITVQASGYFRNQNVSYMTNHFFSNHFKWNEDFSAEKRLHLEGKFRYSLTGTEAKIGIEHITNYHYFDSNFLPAEADERVEIMSAEFSQKLHWRAIHWDNRVLFQTSYDNPVMPLPAFSVESDLSLRFVIAHALTAQLGATAYYTSKYYAPTYQPATQQFALQPNDPDKAFECGGFPLVDAYLNCNLKKIKFFIMYSGIGTNFFSTNTFLMPYYPVQTPRLQYGVSFDLQN